MTPMPAAPVSGYLTTGQAAVRIGATPQYVRELIHAGSLTAIDIGKGARARFRVAEASIEQFLRDVAVTPTVEELAS